MRPTNKSRFATALGGTAFATQGMLTRFATSHTHESMGFAIQAYSLAERSLMWLRRMDEADDLLLESGVYSPEARESAQAERQLRQRILRGMTGIVEALNSIRSAKVATAASVEGELEQAFTASKELEQAKVPKVAGRKRKKVKTAPTPTGIGGPILSLDPRKIAQAAKEIVAKETAKHALVTDD